MPRYIQMPMPHGFVGGLFWPRSKPKDRAEMGHMTSEDPSPEQCGEFEGDLRIVNTGSIEY